MNTDLLNHIIVEGVIPAEWELSTIVNCYKGKGNSLDGENYRGLKLTCQVLKIVWRISKKLIRQQIIDEILFGFMPGCGTTKAIFILRELQENYLATRIWTLHL